VYRQILDKVKHHHKTLTIVLILLLAGLSYGTYKLIGYTISINSKLSAHEEKAARICIIQNTILAAYDIDTSMAAMCASVFDTMSRQYHVPWQAYASVAHIESNFNPIAHSDKGALGLMQVEPQTAIPICAMLKIKYKPEILYGPDGIRIGCIYFSQLVRMNIKDGDTSSVNMHKAIDEALRCYVGGPNHRLLNDSAQVYVKEYTTTTDQEYAHFTYISKGVLYDTVLKELRDEQKKGLIAVIFDHLKRSL